MTTQLIIDGVTVYDSGAAAPVPVPPATGGGSMFKPTSQAQLVSAVQAALDGGYVLYLDPSTSLEINSTCVWTVKDVGGAPKGLCGNYAKFTSMINNGADVFQFVSASNNRSLVVEKFSIYGGAYAGRSCGAGLKISAPKSKAIYQATIRDIFTESCGKNGQHYEGDFFESVLINLQSGANNGDGVYIANGADGGIISNLMVVAPNLSRNNGYGLHLVHANSVDVTLGSFILNALGGVLASNGIRLCHGLNFENSGLIGIDIPTSDYTSTISACNASTEGVTHAPGGVPMLYLYRYHGVPTNLQQNLNYITYYGTGTFTGAVRAP